VTQRAILHEIVIINTAMMYTCPQRFHARCDTAAQEPCAQGTDLDSSRSLIDNASHFSDLDSLKLVGLHDVHIYRDADRCLDLVSRLATDLIEPRIVELIGELRPEFDVDVQSV
jgi:hypothetical protein